MALGVVAIEPGGSNEVNVPLFARTKPCCPPFASKYNPVIAVAGLMAVGLVWSVDPEEPDGVKRLLAARRKPGNFARV
jgi:hypothetical protein